MILNPNSLSKVALIGCGRMGQQHARAIHKSNLKLIAVADPILLCSKTVEKEWNGLENPVIYMNPGELLTRETPDLLVIATTADSHVTEAIKAVKAGVKLILIEKPLSTSLESCFKLNKISRALNARIAVNHQMRFLPQYTIPKKLLDSDKFGGFKSMIISAGNFGMAMNGTHYFEAFRFLSDEIPDKVSAWFDSEILPNPRGPQFQDVSGCIRVTTSSGRRLYIDTSSDQGHGVQVTYMARNGRITVDELTGTMTTVVRQPEHQEAPTSRYGLPVDIEEQKIKPVELVDSTKAVLESLIKGKDFPSLQDATLAVKTLIAAYHSHRKGGISVKLTDIPDDDPEVFPWA